MFCNFRVIFGYAKITQFDGKAKRKIFLLFTSTGKAAIHPPIDWVGRTVKNGFVADWGKSRNGMERTTRVSRQGGRTIGYENRKGQPQV